MGKHLTFKETSKPNKVGGVYASIRGIRVLFREAAFISDKT